MARKAGFTKKDYNRFNALRAQGYSARDISGALNICQANVEAAIDLTEKPAERTLSPAQKGAATRAKKKAETEAQAGQSAEIPQDVNPDDDDGKHPNFM